MAKDKQPDAGLRLVRGLVLLAFSIFLGLSIFSYQWQDISRLHVPANNPPYNIFGPLGAWLSFGLFMLLGLGAYLSPVFCFGAGMLLILGGARRVWPRILWLTLLILAATALIQLAPDRWGDACRRLNIEPHAGGIFGQLTMDGMLTRIMSASGAAIIMWILVLLAFIMLAEPHNILRFLRWIGGRFQSAAARAAHAATERRERLQRMREEEEAIEKQRRRIEMALPRKKEPITTRTTPAPVTTRIPTPLAPEPEAPPPPPRPEKRARRERPATTPETAVAAALPLPNTPPDGFQLPGLDLLDPAPKTAMGIQADTATTARVLVETLAEFGIEVQITNVETGPVVTSYELLPAPGIRVERIANLSSNLALSLKATSVRVQAPIPGKGVVGIEVPNTVSQLVPLRAIVAGTPWLTSKARLPLVLGKDVGGADLVVDLSTMPHLLIAGATGSGKTVCMNSILAGLLMSRTPAQLRLLLVDPKIVEFAIFNNLPHLVVPVITDPKKVALGLRWAINEMEKRYKIFAKAGVRNIESFNSREIARQESLFGETFEAPKKESEIPDRLPYIVIIIDELADLMLADQADIETSIARLAQLSRAVGIHMIIATQRPSVNVITGTIKANFPARIAFQVAQKVDSRTILDTGGADKLLGRGDMLFMPPGASKLIRAQGSMTTDNEIRRITEFLKQQGEPTFISEIKDKLDKSEGAGKMDDGSIEDEELLEQAIAIIRETQRASTSSLQRRLRIGYTRAARIMDILEERGLLGPPRGSEPREILIDLSGDIPENQPDDLNREP